MAVTRWPIPPQERLDSREQGWEGALWQHAKREGEQCSSSSSCNIFLAQMMMIDTAVPIQHTIVFTTAKILQAQQIPKKRNGMAKSGNWFSLLAQESIQKHTEALCSTLLQCVLLRANVLIHSENISWGKKPVHSYLCWWWKQIPRYYLVLIQNKWIKMTCSGSR